MNLDIILIGVGSYVLGFLDALLTYLLIKSARKDYVNAELIELNYLPTQFINWFGLRGVYLFMFFVTFPIFSVLIFVSQMLNNYLALYFILGMLVSVVYANYLNLSQADKINDNLIPTKERANKLKEAIARSERYYEAHFQCKAPQKQTFKYHTHK